MILIITIAESICAEISFFPIRANILSRRIGKERSRYNLKN